MSYQVCQAWARMGRCLGMSVLVVALAVAPAAMAEPAKSSDSKAAARAQKHFERAERLFDLGRFSEAQDQFEAAYRALPTPELLFNIGQCQRNLGDYEGARFSFRRYLTQVPDAPNREAVEELITELEGLIAEEEQARRSEQLTSDPVEAEDRTPAPAPGRSTSSPVYARWWFWTGIATVAAAGTAAYFVVGRDGTIPATDLGNIDFSR